MKPKQKHNWQAYEYQVKDWEEDQYLQEEQTGWEQDEVWQEGDIFTRKKLDWKHDQVCKLEAGIGSEPEREWKQDWDVN